MKNILGMKNIIALCAALFLAGTSLTACVSTDDGEPVDPAVAASAEAPKNDAAAASSESSANNLLSNETKNVAEAKPEGAAPVNNSEQAADLTAESASESGAAAPGETSAPAPEEGAALANAAEGTPAPANAPVDVAPPAANAAPVANATPAAETPADPFAPVAAPAAESSANKTEAPAETEKPEETASADKSAAPAEETASIPAAPQVSEGAGALPEEGTMMPYHVRKGDTLAEIAARLYGDNSRWHELAEQNGIVDPNLIYTGDVLLYRMDAKAKNFAAKQDAPAKKVIKVAAGESLWTIAQRELGSATAWRVIWKDNPGVKNPDVIKVGMELVVTNWMHVAQGDH